MPPFSVIHPSATYTVAEVACMLGQSTATVRRLIDRRHLARVPGIAAVRIPHASVEALIATGAKAQIVLTRELKENGPCLVLAPESIAGIYRVHVQTVYRMLARGSLPTIKWLWCRRVLRSEIVRVFGSELMESTDDHGSRPPAERAGEPSPETAGWVNQYPVPSEGSEGSASTFFFRPPGL